MSQQQQQQQQQQGTEDIRGLIRQRQATAGSAQVLDLSNASLTAFPTEIEFLRDVLEKLTISHNSIRTIPLMLNTFTCLRYLNIRANSIRHMTQLQFLKIEQNHITFPPQEITDIQGQEMEAWLNRLKEFLLEHEELPPMHREISRRAARAASNESLLPPGPSSHRQSRSDSGLRLSIPPMPDGHAGLRSAGLSSSLSPEPLMHKLGRTSSNNVANMHAGSNGEDHYRFISHNRGISGDSTSSFGSTSSSNDCEKFGEIYFQRLAALPSPPTPLSNDKLRMIDAARGILFSFSQIYRAVKQCIGCSTDEKLSQLVSRLLLSANSALTQLIQSLDRFDHAAQVQVPDQKMCSEVLRCCELNVGAFKRLVKAVQAQLKPICLSVDGRLVRNLLLLLHGAISEIRVAWDSLLALIPGALEAKAMAEGHHVSQIPYQHPNHSNSATHLALGHHQHPLQLSPTLQATPSFGPSYVPQRSQNLSRASNHSAASFGHGYQDDEEDIQFLSTVESAIEAARRLIQCLTETCITRSEGLAPSPPSASPGAPRPGPSTWNRSVTTSPVRSSGSSTSGKSVHSSGGRLTGPGVSGSVNSAAGGDKSDNGPDTGSSLAMSPVQLAVDTKASNGTNSNTTDYLIRSPLFSPVSDNIPYSNGMCVSLPIGIPAQPNTKAGATLSSSPSNNSTPQDAALMSDTLPSLPVSSAPRGDGRKMSIWNQRAISGNRQAPGIPSSPVSTKTAFSSTATSAATSESVSSGLQQGVQAPLANNAAAQTTAGGLGTRASTPRADDINGSGGAQPTTTTFQSMPLGPRSFSNAGIIGSGSMASRATGIPHQGMLMTGGISGSISSSLPSGGFLTNGGFMAIGSSTGPVHPHHPHHPHHHHYHHHPFNTNHSNGSSSSSNNNNSGNSNNHFYSHSNNTNTQLVTPLPALSTAATLQNIGSGATPTQLWRDMRDSLNQMTEIVKRLDLDLSMLRVDEYQGGGGGGGGVAYVHGGGGGGMHAHGHGFLPYHPHHVSSSGGGGNSGSVMMHPNHPHYPSTPGINGSFSGTDEGNALRRRFVAGLNDFVKSVIVISTLVKQLSSTLSTTSSLNSTTTTGATGNNTLTTTTTTTTTTTMTTTTMTAMTTMTTSSSAATAGATATSTSGTTAAMALAHLQRNQSPPTSPMLKSTGTTSSSRTVSSPSQRRSKSDSSTADIMGVGSGGGGGGSTAATGGGAGASANRSFASSVANMNLEATTGDSASGGDHETGTTAVEGDAVGRSMVVAVTGPGSAAAASAVATAAAAAAAAATTSTATIATRVKAGRSSSTSAGGDIRHNHHHHHHQHQQHHHLATTASPVLTPRMTSRSVSMSTIAEKAAGTRSTGAESLSQSQPQQPQQPQPQQQQQQPQQPQQQPEVFSRLVLTSVSSLTKITKELTLRLPKSSFRDMMMSQGGGASGGVGGGNSGGGAGGMSLLGHALGGGGGAAAGGGVPGAGGQAHHPSSGSGGGSSSLPGSGFTTPLSASMPYRHPLLPMGPSYLTGRKASLV
ncbi:RAM signaling network component [Actinomortierella ambigua]|uniref:RAM signaling network component n=1 Tax=Actinomortierella ambigua TaxID=1343610 RepID=A0A9P6QHW2_9FUNG|nr:RAM signaling network component [Actinomortierella ambigua]